MTYNRCGPDDYKDSSPIKQRCPKVEMMWGKRRDIIVRDRLPFNAEPPGPRWPVPRSPRWTPFTAAITVHFPTLHATSGA
jgi:hypothetical protein